ncbi:MAG: BREX system Lon protease-like protein BrxL [Halobacteriovoraceae bacterium]|nr:BREX system Lon protease-like protein BrxL [Halobacteriovoraceae bacterium]
MKQFEEKAKDAFGEIIINKSFIHNAGFGSRAIPTYVSEWIISHFVKEGEEISEHARERIAAFANKFIPQKSEKESIKNRLFEQEEVQILDNYSIQVNLTKGERYLQIPFLDESNAQAASTIIDENEMLLSNGLWGVGTLFYVPRSDSAKTGQIWMREFKPFQIANIDLDYFFTARKEFSTEEWVDFIVSSMGFNPDVYTERQKILLISRLIPMVEPRYNLVELAPKGTGKSFVFENMSRYVAVRSGNITPAVLFFNDSRKTAGLITKFDVVVIDEAQKVRGDSSGELTALLKSYLESGKFGKGSANAIAAEAGMVILANIEIGQNRKPIYEDQGLFKVFPNFLRETAFIDRFSGLLPGWDLPRITKSTPSKYLGLKGDIFGEILHKLRHNISFRDYVKTHMELKGSEDMRDSKAIEAGASGLMKVLFPHQEVGEEEFYQYCVNPVVEYRQRVKDELCKLDREYTPVSIQSKIPSSFQITHIKPSFFGGKITESQTANHENVKENINQPRTTQDDPYSPDRDPTEGTIHINEDETGWSYERIFYPYLKEAKEIHCIDPHLKWEYQIRNFLEFCEMLGGKMEPVKLHLVTSYDNLEQKELNAKKFAAIAKNLENHNITFEVEFDRSQHDRSIETDDGWRIIPGRGLDIFQKPEYDLHQGEQIKRKCRKSTIDFRKRW